MNKADLLSRVGHMDQLASLRLVSHESGPARGLRALELLNGPMRLSLLADKALDIADFSYKGQNFNFLAKPGLLARESQDGKGQEAVRSVMGGLLFTSGLTNTCPPCQLADVTYPMHGRMRNQVAENLSYAAYWQDNAYILEASGQMREASLFGENLVMRRTVTTVYGSKSFVLHDRIENQGFREEGLMMLYHINFGFPFLDEACEIAIPSYAVRVRDETTKFAEAHWSRMEAPSPGEPEYVFLHEVAADPQNMVTCAIYNHELELGLEIRYSATNLPKFMQWKSLASGDYVLAFEPTNSGPYGRAHEIESGNLHTLLPGQSEENILRFTVLEGAKDFQATCAVIDQCLSKHLDTL
ncbi:MAG: aldose 1-epimerase family protein [Eubacteriales bacterium]|nr:aldose 1-epimerase family protein [Clostridiales bacterium]MDY5836955.1 aldose 1-epimerase family protein [Eubacteriales bacterium]